MNAREAESNSVLWQMHSFIAVSKVESRKVRLTAPPAVPQGRQVF